MDNKTSREERADDAVSDFFRRVIPGKLELDSDPLVAQVSLHNQSCFLRFFENNVVITKMVSANDIVRIFTAMADYSTGILPEGTIWWSNTREGAKYAFYTEPKVRILTLQERLQEPPRRFRLPLPGCIFICQAGRAPSVYAAKKRPAKPSDIIYAAPFANIFADGRVCSGNHRFTDKVSAIPEEFFTSFFTSTADLSNRSKMFPKNIIGLWEFLEGKRQYPLNDLIKMGTIKDIL